MCFGKSPSAHKSQTRSGVIARDRLTIGLTQITPDTFEPGKAASANSVYLTNTYSSTKNGRKDILIFKAISLSPRKTFHFLVETKGGPAGFSVQNLMLSPETSRFERFYKVKMFKNSMGTSCLFAGKDLFKSAANAPGSRFAFVSRSLTK